MKMRETRFERRMTTHNPSQTLSPATLRNRRHSHLASHISKRIERRMTTHNPSQTLSPATLRNRRHSHLASRISYLIERRMTTHNPSQTLSPATLRQRRHTHLASRTSYLIASLLLVTPCIHPEASAIPSAQSSVDTNDPTAGRKLLDKMVE